MAHSQRMTTFLHRFANEETHIHPDWKELKRGPYAKWVLAVIVLNEIRGLWAVSEAVRWMV